MTEPVTPPPPTDGESQKLLMGVTWAAQMLERSIKNPKSCPENSEHYANLLATRVNFVNDKGLTLPDAAKEAIENAKNSYEKVLRTIEAAQKDPLPAVLKKVNADCLKMVNQMDLNHIKATYKSIEAEGVDWGHTVRIDIPLKPECSFPNLQFLGAILDADPKLITVGSGGNNGYISYRVTVEESSALSAQELVTQSKNAVIKRLNNYKNASPEEQTLIAKNGLKNYQWFQENHSFPKDGGDLEILQRDVANSRQSQRR